MTKMSSLSEFFWEGKSRVITSIEQFDQMVLELETEALNTHPFIAELVTTNKKVFSIGFGSPLSVASYSPSFGVHFHSIGNDSNSETMVFFYGGSWSEIRRRYAIPFALAKAALRTFYLTEKPI